VRRPLAIAIAGLVLLAGAPVALAGPADRAAASRGAAWLQRQPAPSFGGQQADTIVALRAARVPRSRLRGRVRRLAVTGRRYGSRPGPAAKVARAALAVGADPRRFGRVNYLARIRRGYRAGVFGSNVFDHSLAILALRGAGEGVPRRAIAVLRRTRGRGGWGLELRSGGRDEVDATAVVIQAMRAAGLRRTDRDLRAATAWLARQAHRRGGFDARGGRRPAEANSTAAAILALAAMGRSSVAARRELRALQRRDGAFNWRSRTPGSRILATIDAVTALSR
jgi:hypothetical protein